MVLWYPAVNYAHIHKKAVCVTQTPQNHIQGQVTFAHVVVFRSTLVIQNRNTFPSVDLPPLLTVVRATQTVSIRTLGGSKRSYSVPAFFCETLIFLSLADLRRADKKEKIGEQSIRSLKI